MTLYAEMETKYRNLMMHVATCPMCGSLQPISCETGRTMAISWLEFSAKKLGSKQAQKMLDLLKAANYDHTALIPPGTQIRRI